MAEIAATLRKSPNLEITRIEHEFGEHFYYYRIEMPECDLLRPVDRANGERLYGLGFDFSEPLAIIRAWAEFLERLSFFVHASKANSNVTTNGFASHTSANLAASAAVAELVERDALLCCWLLRLPAMLVDLNRHAHLRPKLRFLQDLGLTAHFGILATCMGFTIGIGLLSDSNRCAIVAAAKKDSAFLMEHLVLQCFEVAVTWNGPNSLEPINELPATVLPRHHAQLYLSGGHERISSWFFAESKATRSLPEFDVQTNDLTRHNELAAATGFHVKHALSSRCQQLWIGETNPDQVNLRRLGLITGTDVSFCELNEMPHPLP